MDAQQEQDEVLKGMASRSKATPEKLRKLREENVGLTLETGSTPQTGLLERVMAKHRLSRDEALSEIEKFGG
jgi:hypothetical protein